jgi:hypothetical protein
MLVPAPSLQLAGMVPVVLSVAPTVEKATEPVMSIAAAHSSLAGVGGAEVDTVRL